MHSLFDINPPAASEAPSPSAAQAGAATPPPLADALRPKTRADVLGQTHVLEKDALIPQVLEGMAQTAAPLPSMIFWGPPGCGKTTLARILAKEAGGHFEAVSAVTSGVGELKKLFSAAAQRRTRGMATLLFVDEIHRFNRAQQDAFLPHMEDGTVSLLGATTENPSFALNNALLSRCQVVVLQPLSSEDMQQLLIKAEEHLGCQLPLNDDARTQLCQMADGDARYLLNMCEVLAHARRPDNAPMDSAQMQALLQRRMPQYDRQQDAHYNLISALHKSLRGSDTNAALYWLARMLDGGEDPLYIARRLIRFASEDIGLADPHALQQALAAREAYACLGSPEGELALAQAVIYLGTAPKSNAAYRAYTHARKDAQRHGSLMPPKHILNAPTALMQELGYSDGYVYDHDTEDAFSGQSYFPESMPEGAYYAPKPYGFERDIQKRLKYWQSLREKPHKTPSKK